eukprot:m.55961 g.55961  ORF g.55961 m.55961 type:complete len:1077 (+) comp7780_c0_seq3:155-3385(+)
MEYGYELEDNLAAIAAEKESEWRKVEAARYAKLTGEVKEKTLRLQQLQDKFATLRDDFTYNLTLLEERDKQLDKYEGYFKDVRSAWMELEQKVSDLQVSLADEKDKQQFEHKRCVQIEDYYKTRMTQMQNDFEEERRVFHANAREQFESVVVENRALQMRLNDFSHRSSIERKELVAEHEGILQRSFSDLKEQLSEQKQQTEKSRMQVRLKEKDIELLQEKVAIMESQRKAMEHQVEEALEGQRMAKMLLEENTHANATRIQSLQWEHERAMEDKDKLIVEENEKCDAVKKQLERALQANTQLREEYNTRESTLSSSIESERGRVLELVRNIEELQAFVRQKDVHIQQQTDAISLLREKVTTLETQLLEEKQSREREASIHRQECAKLQLRIEEVTRAKEALVKETKSLCNDMERLREREVIAHKGLIESSQQEKSTTSVLVKQEREAYEGALSQLRDTVGQSKAIITRLLAGVNPIVSEDASSLLESLQRNPNLYGVGASANEKVHALHAPISNPSSSKKYESIIGELDARVNVLRAQDVEKNVTISQLEHRLRQVSHAHAEALVVARRWERKSILLRKQLDDDDEERIAMTTKHNEELLSLARQHNVAESQASALVNICVTHSEQLSSLQAILDDALTFMHSPKAKDPTEVGRVFERVLSSLGEQMASFVRAVSCKRKEVEESFKMKENVIEEKVDQLERLIAQQRRALRESEEACEHMEQEMKAQALEFEQHAAEQFAVNQSHREQEESMRHQLQLQRLLIQQQQQLKHPPHTHSHQQQHYHQHPLHHHTQEQKEKKEGVIINKQNVRDESMGMDHVQHSHHEADIISSSVSSNSDDAINDNNIKSISSNSNNDMDIIHDTTVRARPQRRPYQPAFHQKSISGMGDYIRPTTAVSALSLGSIGDGLEGVWALVDDGADTHASGRRRGGGETIVTNSSMDDVFLNPLAYSGGTIRDRVENSSKKIKVMNSDTLHPLHEIVHDGDDGGGDDDDVLAFAKTPLPPEEREQRRPSFGQKQLKPNKMQNEVSSPPLVQQAPTQQSSMKNGKARVMHIPRNYNRLRSQHDDTWPNTKRN